MKRFRVDLRLVVAAGLALAAGAGVHALTRPAPQVEVLVAGAPLPPGVRLAELPIATRLMSPVPGLIAVADAALLGDHSLSAAIAQDDPVLASLLVPPPTEQPDVAALTLDPAHAVQGDLVAGDRVDIYATRDGVTELLAQDVLVLAAATGSGGLGEDDAALLLAVDRSLAAALVRATHTADIDLVRTSR